MKLESTYRFFKVYFSYGTSRNRIYGRAASEAMKVIKDTLNQKTLNPILTYLHKPFPLTITKGMLLRLVTLAMSEYQDPFNEIQYFNITADIDKSLLTTNRRGIIISLIGGYDKKNNKLIFPTFGPPSNMVEEVRVIKGLLKEFVTADYVPTNIRTVAYWDLSKGKSTEVDFQPLQPVDRQSLIDAANRI